MRTRRSQSSSDPTPSRGVEGHIPVLLQETLRLLAIQPDDIVVDGTLGGAGHAREIAQLLGSNGTLIGFDLDTDAIARAKEALSVSKAHIHLVQANFRHVERELSSRSIDRITKVLLDLGWSSYQLDAGRGFSFLRDEPLKMTYAKDAEQVLTAETIVNQWEEGNLADVLFGWGEERYARRIARQIVQVRERERITSSRQLAEIVRAAVPPQARFGRTHPATKTFQALRIAVNDELGALTEGMDVAWRLLAPGGRIAIISFHSIEDRLVKRQFAKWRESGEAISLSKKPLTASPAELLRNPRARSAKLRVIEKQPIQTYA